MPQVQIPDIRSSLSLWLSRADFANNLFRLSLLSSQGRIILLGNNQQHPAVRTAKGHFVYLISTEYIYCAATSPAIIHRNGVNKQLQLHSN